MKKPFCCTLEPKLTTIFHFCPYLERYYEPSVPDSIVTAIRFDGTIKTSPASVIAIDSLLLLDHEDPDRASGISPRASP
ncbi:hypothetical protein SADUNF_Sadunf08G0115300 [Salix dunnii]|uniref:Uncharacterized protein n=1 Tax=Salix dunnii TaxID=1413687 RepID=A0A835MXX8_9ROSI|nr:hypothetical protein SADUNF_Sadunf08G0115300 [Salix dunnii]